jgi:hypothetical protein
MPETTKKSDISIDLDELAPLSVELKYLGKKIMVEAPSLSQYASVIDYSEQLRNLKKSDVKSVADIYEKIAVFIKEVIPELKEVKLNFAQVSSLFKLLAEIGAPTDKAVDKLKAQGIDLKPKEDNKSPKVSA